MKAPRRLGKGLADLVSLQRGKAGDEDGAADDESAPSILQLLSTPPAEDAVDAATAVDVEAVEDAASPVEVVEEVAPESAVEAVAPEPVRVSEPAAEAPSEPVGPAPTPAMTPEPVEPEPAFVDDWFDPPIAGFSPAGAFERVESPAPPVPEAPPAAVRETPAAEPPADARDPVKPKKPVPPAPPQPEAPKPPADAPVLLEDEFFLDDFVVGSHLPDVDLDS